MRKTKKQLKNSQNRDGKIFIFSSDSIAVLAAREGAMWLNLQQINHGEGSFMNAFRIYMAEKFSARDDEIIAKIIGINKNEYLVKGNGEIVSDEPNIDELIKKL